MLSESAVKVAETAFWCSALTAILISISLKSTWNIMNVMQVVAYTRLYSNWPANIKTVMDNVQLAITMDIFFDRMMNFGKDQYEIAAAKMSNEELTRVGVSDPRLYRSLSIFALIFTFLALMMLVYFLCRVINRKCPKVQPLKDYLKKKLFYSAWIRYLIESNLKLTHNVVIFLLIFGSFDSLTDGG